MWWRGLASKFGIKVVGAFAGESHDSMQAKMKNVDVVGGLKMANYAKYLEEDTAVGIKERTAGRAKT